MTASSAGGTQRCTGMREVTHLSSLALPCRRRWLRCTTCARLGAVETAIHASNRWIAGASIAMRLVSASTFDTRFRDRASASAWSSSRCRDQSGSRQAGSGESPRGAVRTDTGTLADEVIAAKTRIAVSSRPMAAAGPAPGLTSDACLHTDRRPKARSTGCGQTNGVTTVVMRDPSGHDPSKEACLRSRMRARNGRILSS